jgi:orotidine-5'-phosphate decarboxylase
VPSPLFPAPASSRDRLIFALDVDDLDSAERLVRRLAPHVGVFKVGPVLFTSVGPLVVDLIHGMGAGVFLDLKFHDIPATVAGAAREAAHQRVKMFTVHALGGRQMIKGASVELQRMTLVPGVAPPMCLAVTVLTSHRPEDLADIGITGSLEEASGALAKLALESGAVGVVASARELPHLRKVCHPNTIYVTPGIRGASDSADDQARAVSAKEAIEAGADYLVVGRPIRDAADPVEAARRILDEMDAAKSPNRG